MTSSPPRRSQASEGRRQSPLAGITVVTVEQAVSAPLCTRTLADLGARVIKVENPEGGDFARDYDDVVHGMAAHFVWLNRGKESVSLDLKKPEARAVLHRLLETADVFVTNLAPGATERLGLDPPTLQERHQHLLLCEISGYGAGGPLSHKRAYDLLVQAESGACSITGWPDQPAKPGPPMADACAGLYGAISLLATLHARGTTGRGAATAVSLFDTMTELMGYPMTWSRYAGVDQQPVGMGSPAVAPYSAYRTADDQTVVLGTTNNAEWRRLAHDMLGRAELAADSRFATGSGRVACRDELDDEIAQWCAGHDLVDIQAAADAAGIGNARYNTVLDVVGHPHLVARDRFRDVSSPVGPVTAVLPPPIIAGQELPMGAIPGLGEHTDLVLADHGYDVGAIAELRSSGAIGRW